MHLHPGEYDISLEDITKKMGEDKEE